MAATEHYYTKFVEGQYYHVYNRSVDKKALFKGNDNYYYFLKKYDEYLSQLVDTFAFCLLGNHFHLLIRIQDLSAFRIADIDKIEQRQSLSAHDIVSRQFRKFFQSYSMAFNKQQNRVGTLFQTPFKRVLVDNNHYFRQLVYYIHANPQLHGIIDDFKKWEWSSYGRILIDKPTKLKKQEVISWYGTRDAYTNYHLVSEEIQLDKKYLVED